MLAVACGAFFPNLQRLGCELHRRINVALGCASLSDLRRRARGIARRNPTGYEMLLGCIADDFTGASDLANTLTRSGMATIQFVGTPASDAPADCDAGVVALKIRSTKSDDAVAEALAALSWLRQQGCAQYMYKYCSTFDSTPDGNIGPVCEALADALDVPVAAVCPAFPTTGRAVFMGHLFVNDRLLNESGMEKHPLNPMTDPDIRRWLRRQTRHDVGLTPYRVVREGATAIRAALDAEAAAGRRLVIVDAAIDEDLREIGKAVAGHKLVTGGSGIAIGLPDNFRKVGLLAHSASGFNPIVGPGVVLSGSCSTASLAQVAAYVADHPGFKIDADAILSKRMTVSDAFRFVMDHVDTAPIVYSTAEPSTVASAQRRHGREQIAAAIEVFFGDLAKRLASASVCRLVVGGGETSGAVVTALGLKSFRIGPEIDPGVPVLEANGQQPMLLALKSGNFGAVDFYAKALRMMEAS
jgi:3-dehydrotetronate 4-kinase